MFWGLVRPEKFLFWTKHDKKTLDLSESNKYKLVQIVVGFNVISLRKSENLKP
jgi:hypothetical protein